MKPLLLLLTGFLLISAVSAANVTSNFTSTDTARITHSYQLDPTGRWSTPWELYILSGIIGLLLVIYAIVRQKASKLDYEVDIILSILSWPFLIFFAWSGLTSVDRIVGTGVTSTDGVTVMITQHILYTFPLEGWLGVAGAVGAIFVTILLIAQFRMFKDQSAGQTT